MIKTSIPIASMSDFCETGDSVLMPVGFFDDVAYVVHPAVRRMHDQTQDSINIAFEPMRVANFKHVHAWDHSTNTTTKEGLKAVADWVTALVANHPTQQQLSDYPALKDAWDAYQTVLALCTGGQA